MATEAPTGARSRLAGLADEPLLEIAGLVVAAGAVPLLRGVELVVPPGARVGIVGESGSGKSMTASAILGLLPPGVEARGGSIRLRGRDLRTMSERELRSVRGGEIAIVYQNAVASLNPLQTVGSQIARVCRAHTGVSRLTPSDAPSTCSTGSGSPTPTGAPGPTRTSSRVAWPSGWPSRWP